MSQNAQVPSRSAFPTIVAILGVLLLFYILLNVTYLNSNKAPEPPQLDRPSVEELKAKAKDLLSEYAVVDAAAGKVRLPIERAKELVIAENSK